MAKRKTTKRKPHQRQAFGVLLLGISALIFLAIVSFNVNDPVNLNVQGNRILVHNWLGPLGSSLSYFLMQWTFGYPILVLPVLLFLMALHAIQDKPFDGLMRTSILLLSWAFIASIYLALPEAFAKMGRLTEYYPSGLFGGWAASKLVIYLGKFGSLASLIVFTVVLFILSLKVEIAGVIHVLAAGFSSFNKTVARVWDTLMQKIADGRQKSKEKRQARKIQKLKEREDAQAAAQAVGQFGPEQPVTDKIPEINIDEPGKNDPVKPPLEFEKPQLPPDNSQNETGPQMIQTTLDDIIASLDARQNPEQSEVPPTDDTNNQEMGFEVQEETIDEQVDYDQQVKESVARYKFPSIDLLKSPPTDDLSVTREELKSNAELLETKLLDFGVKAKVIRVTAGPVITLYELQPAPGVKVSSIVTLANDLALTMEARGIRIDAPIPGKAAVGIEIPNRSPQMVYLKSLIRSEKFSTADYELPLAIGKTINGESYIADLTKMPHVLIAGATGSGKSVGINTIISSLLYAVNPGKVKFMMVDPKKLELSIYRDLRDHYLLWRPDLDEEVVTKPNNAVSMLNSMVLEMERRYDQLAKLGVRNIIEYNNRVQENGKKVKDLKCQQLPYIVVLIDELADLMMVAAKEVEAPIARLAQMARAVGLHLIVATQRPSVDVITGVIKANFPARIAYQVATKVDSRTVLDMNGAEQLLGNGDMLFLPAGRPKPIRLQNPFISTDEVESVIDHIHRQTKLPYYSVPQPSASRGGSAGDFAGGEDRDILYEDARAIVVQHQQGSISFLQRRLKIGYSRAARLMDELEEDGVVGPADGSKPREVRITLQELQDM